MRKLKKAPRAKRNWTPEEEAYLSDKWGEMSVLCIAKKLGRSDNAVVVRAQRLGLGAHLESDTRISVNQLMLTLFGGVALGAYTRDRYIRYGMPVKKHRVKNNTFLVIDIPEFWKWAEQHKDILNFASFEAFALGPEPAWVKQKRKLDVERHRAIGPHNAPWTQAEDGKLIRMLSQHRFTYEQLATELRHTEGAVKRRIYDLQLTERPIRSPSKPWTPEEEEILLQMMEQGYRFENIAKSLGRTALGVRGKYERLQNPEYIRRYHRERRGGFEATAGKDYLGLRDIRPEEIRDNIRRREAEFYEVL